MDFIAVSGETGRIICTFHILECKGEKLFASSPVFPYNIIHPDTAVSTYFFKTLFAIGIVEKSTAITEEDNKKKTSHVLCSKTYFTEDVAMLFVSRPHFTLRFPTISPIL